MHCKHVEVVQFKLVDLYINISHLKCVLFFSFVSVFSLDPNEEYKMNRKKRGMALIFNHERFYWQLMLNNRSGTTADRENLVRRYIG